MEEKTKFEELLSSMELEDKRQVFSALTTVYNLFKGYAERAGLKWLEIMPQDEPLRVIFICDSIAGQMWFDEQRKKELESQNENQES